MGQVKLVASANKRSIQENDFVTVQFNIENTSQVDQFIPPTFRGCKVVQGPMHVTGASVINGAQRNYVSFVYVLQPLTTGRLSFTGASAKVNGNRHMFNPIKVDVTESNQSAGNFTLPKGLRDDLPENQLYSDYVLRKGENVQDKIRKNLFIKVDVNTKSCYEGEPIVASYKLYTRLRSESKISRRPSFNGFSVYDMVDPTVQPSGVENLGGKDFNVYLIRKAQLFPLQSGQLELDAAEVDNAVTFLDAEHAVHNEGRNLPELLRAFDRDDVSNPAVKTERVSIRSNPVTINIKSLPEESKPASFDGAVGKFSVEASIDKKKVVVNDAATLKVIVKGEGNFGIINAPSVRWPQVVEAYDASAKEDFLRNMVPLRGYKTFEFTFVPKEQGSIVIPPIEFSYFDPKLKQYQTVYTDSLRLMAAAPLTEAALTDQADLSGSPAMGARGWLIGGGVLLLMPLGWILYRKMRLSFNGSDDSNFASSPSGNADQNSPVSISQLQTEEPAYTPDPLFHARLMMIQSNSQGFYSELSKAVKIAAATFLHLRHDTDKYTIEKEFTAANADEILLSQFQLILQQCEVALYTPTMDDGDMQSAYDFAEDFIHQLKEMKKPETGRYSSEN